MAVENKGGENPHDFNLKSSVLGIQTFSLQTFSNTKFCSRNTVSYKQNNPTNKKKKQLKTETHTKSYWEVNEVFTIQTLSYDVDFVLSD